MGEKELAHYGVKGMKWGVRKARTGQLDEHATRLERVASGKGSFSDKKYAVARTSLPGQLSRGLKRQSALEAKNSRAEIKRLATGKAKTGDILRAYANANVVGIVRSRRDDNSFDDKVKKQMSKKGQTKSQAEKSVKRKQAAVSAAITGAYVVTRILAEHGGPVLSQYTAGRAHVNRQRAQRSQTTGLPRRPTNGPTFTKKRNGVYNISSM